MGQWSASYHSALSLSDQKITVKPDLPTLLVHQKLGSSRFLSIVVRYQTTDAF